MKIVQTTAEHVCHVAAHLRDGDREELRLWDGSTPAQAVLASVRESQVVNTVIVQGQAAALCGVNRGRVWMLGTPALFQSRREVRQSVKLARAWVAQQKRRFGTLFNHVWAGNTASIRWLRWLGFQLDAPRNIGQSGALFHPFHYA